MATHPEQERPRRTLALHFGALGDFVLSWPALGLLMAGPPASELHLVGRPAWGGLILPPERVRDRESARLAGLFLLEPAGEVDAWLGGFERAVVFAQRPDPALLAHLRLAGIKEIWPLPTRPPAGLRLHAGEVQVQALRARGLTGPAQAPALRLEPPGQAGPPVLAPGSGGAAKRLSPELAARAARRLAQAFGPPLVLLGPAETYARDPAWRAALDKALTATPHQVLEDAPLTEVARALLAAPVYMGADSGVTHLAAALGAPTLALFQASDPVIWAPKGAQVCGHGDWEAVLGEPRQRRDGA